MSGAQQTGTPVNHAAGGRVEFVVRVGSQFVRFWARAGETVTWGRIR